MSKYARRHYEDVAAVLSDALARCNGPEATEAVEALAADFARMFSVDNPRFNVERFNAAASP